MAELTIEGLKNALTYVQDNSNITWYEAGPRKGLMVTDGMSEEDAYHLRVVQSLEPRLIVRLAEQYTQLSLDGQELLHMLSDDRYLDSLRLQLQKNNGYTQPADVQIFKLLRKQLDGTAPTASWPDVIKLLVERSREKPVLPNLDIPAAVIAPSPAQPENLELSPQPEPEPEPDPIPEAAKIIKSAKQKVNKQSAEA